MANLRYPSGLKVKAPLAWVSAVTMGFAPMIFFYYNYLMKEHYVGVSHRLTYGEDKLVLNLIY